VSKSKRPQSRTRSSVSRVNDHISHLHVVIDDELREKLEAHARKLEGIPPRAKNYDRPNLSAAVRDLLRSKLGLPGAEAA
jgi:hypothetical protein